MSQQGGKVNKSLKDWVAFVKKVQKEEKLSYKDAIIRAKARKDKGEKWMSGGAVPTTPSENTSTDEVMEETVEEVTPESEKFEEEMVRSTDNSNIAGGKRTRRRNRSRARGRGRARSAKRSRSARRSRARGRY